MLHDIIMQMVFVNNLKRTKKNTCNRSTTKCLPHVHHLEMSPFIGTFIYTKCNVTVFRERFEPGSFWVTRMRSSWTDQLLINIFSKYFSFPYSRPNLIFMIRKNFQSNSLPFIFDKDIDRGSALDISCEVAQFSHAHARTQEQRLLMIRWDHSQHLQSGGARYVVASNQAFPALYTFHPTCCYWRRLLGAFPEQSSSIATCRVGSI